MAMQLLIFLKAGIRGLQVVQTGVGGDVWEWALCHGTQSTYHAKSRIECSSGPGRPSIPGKLIVINQVTETEQGLARTWPATTFPSSLPGLSSCFSPLLSSLIPSFTTFLHLHLSSRLQKTNCKQSKTHFVVCFAASQNNFP